MSIFIDNDDDLQQFLTLIEGETIWAVDTEFMRDKQYYAMLCLIQVATSKGYAVIDTKAGLNLAPFYKALYNPNITKVFHAGKQDIEILYNLHGAIPTPIYDTQIMAMALGLGDQVGYQQLVQKISNITLDKSHQLTDWAKRPLSHDAVEYASYDVIYLLDIYIKLHDMLVQKKRLSWIAEELSALCDDSQYCIIPNNMWMRFKKIPDSKIKRRALQQLATWREHKAMNRNIPRSFVMKDETILDIVAKMPKKPQDLTRIRNIGIYGQQQKKQQEILKILHNISADDAPEITRAPPVIVDKTLLEMLKWLCKIISQQQHIAPKLIAQESDFIAFLRHKNDSAFMHGWRYEIFGCYAEKFTQGEFFLGWQDGDIIFKEL